MPVIDLSLLVPLFDADHPRHEEARKLVGAPILLHITGGVLAELTIVLRQRGNDVGMDGARIAREALCHLEKLQDFRHATDTIPSRPPAPTLPTLLGEYLLSFDEQQMAAYHKERRST